MAREENSGGDSEVGVVNGQFVGHGFRLPTTGFRLRAWKAARVSRGAQLLADAGSEIPSNFPEIGKQGPADGRCEVSGASRTSRPALYADRPLDHLHVAIAPLLQPLVEIDQALTEFRVLRIRAIDLDQERLNLGRRFGGPSHVARELRGRHRIA